jgi:hypothetical protein
LQEQHIKPSNIPSATWQNGGTAVTSKCTNIMVNGKTTLEDDH